MSDATIPAERALTPIQANYLELRKQLDKREEEIAALAGDLVDPKRMKALVLSISKNNAKIAACTTVSIVTFALDCARLGLEPTGRVGGMWPVPFKVKGTPTLQGITDYRGEITLAVRSGFAQDVKPVIVYEGDEFDWEEGDKPRLFHKPTRDEKRRGDAQLYYSRVMLPSGAFTWEVMLMADILRHMNRSRAKDSGPWVTDFDRMAQKTTVRRACNRLAKSSAVIQGPNLKIARAYLDHVQREEAREYGEEEDIIELEPEEEGDLEKPPEGRTDSLKEHLKKQQEKR